MVNNELYHNMLFFLEGHIHFAFPFFASFMASKLYSGSVLN